MKKKRKVVRHSKQRKPRSLIGIKMLAIRPPYAAAADEWKKLQKVPYKVVVEGDCHPGPGRKYEWVAAHSARGRGLYKLDDLKSAS